MKGEPERIIEEICGQVKLQWEQWKQEQAG